METKKIRSIDAPAYIPSEPADAQGIIDMAIEILANRLRKPGQQFKSPATVKEYCILTAKHDDRERIRVLFLDSQHQLIADECLAEGTLTQASVYPREFVRRAIELGAGAVILTHNHPSGVADASRADIAMTKHLKDALALIDVKLLDHIITAGTKANSLAESGDI